MTPGKKALLSFAVLLVVFTLVGPPPVVGAICGYYTEILYFGIVNGKRFPVGQCVKNCNESFYTCSGEKTDDSRVTTEPCYC